MFPERRVARVLTIAGSDCGGGAGIQADLKVITCLGGYGMSAITALTAQDTRGVWGVMPVPADFVAQQIDLCLNDIGADAIKTGMLCNSEIVTAVAQCLKAHEAPNLVVDPVMYSKSGHSLLDEAAEAAVIEELLPLCTVITPNLPEATRLAGFDVVDAEGMIKAAEAIIQFGPSAVLIKGGHLPDVACDLLFDGKEFVELPGERIESRNTHGTGCSFASALATELALGANLPTAARRAKMFITEAIRTAFDLGEGHGPTNPLAGAKGMQNFEF